MKIRSQLTNRTRIQLQQFCRAGLAADPHVWIQVEPENRAASACTGFQLVMDGWGSLWFVVCDTRTRTHIFRRADASLDELNYQNSLLLTQQVRKGSVLSPWKRSFIQTDKTLTFSPNSLFLE